MGGKTLECWPLKGQRRGGSGKMFSLFLKGMKIKARFVLSPVELIPGKLGSGCQGSELSGLFLVCGSYCDLRLDRSVSALELGARVPAECFSESGGLWVHSCLGSEAREAQFRRHCLCQRLFTSAWPHPS